MLFPVCFICRMIRDGYFGFQDYFKPLCDTVEGGNDFYLLGPDFGSYLEAQVILVSLGDLASLSQNMYGF